MLRLPCEKNGHKYFEKTIVRAGFMVHVLGSNPSDILPELRFM